MQCQPSGRNFRCDSSLAYLGPRKESLARAHSLLPAPALYLQLKPSVMSAVAARVFTSAEVLSLYRQLLRAGRQLKLTDQSWYRKEIRKNFEKHRDKVDNSLYVEVVNSTHL